MIVFKKYTSKVEEIFDPEEGYIQVVKIPDEILDELGWKEGDKIEIKAQMTDHDNVLVLSKVK